MPISTKLDWISQDYILSALQQLKIGYWFLDLLALQLKCTDQCKDTFGYTPDQEMSLSDFLDRIYPEDRPKVEQAFYRTLNVPSEVYRVQYRIITPQGEMRWIQASGYIIYEGDEFVAMAGITQDITHLI